MHILLDAVADCPLSFNGGFVMVYQAHPAYSSRMRMSAKEWTILFLAEVECLKDNRPVCWLWEHRELVSSY